MTNLSILAEQVGASERTLRRAAALGAIRATRPTPRTLELTLAERRYVRRSWPLLSALRDALRTEHNVRFALLYGSAAVGTETSTRDIDILVDMDDTGLERIADLTTKLESRCKIKVDVTRLEDATADRVFLADAVAGGRVLVDRNKLWPNLKASASSLQKRAGRADRARSRAALAGIDRWLNG